MNEDLRCKDCNTPLIIKTELGCDEAIGIYMKQTLHCPKCEEKAKGEKDD